MKYTFYLEYPSDEERELATVENLGNHSGTVLAVPSHCNLVNGVQCVGEVVCSKRIAICYVSPVHLKNSCMVIPEEKAREIHSELFTYLEK